MVVKGRFISPVLIGIKFLVYLYSVIAFKVEFGIFNFFAPSICSTNLKNYILVPRVGTGEVKGLRF